MVAAVVEVDGGGGLSGQRSVTHLRPVVAPQLLRRGRLHLEMECMEGKRRA